MIAENQQLEKDIENLKRETTKLKLEIKKNKIQNITKEYKKKKDHYIKISDFDFLNFITTYTMSKPTRNIQRHKFFKFLNISKQIK